MAGKPVVNVSNDDVLNLFRETGALLEGHFQLTSGLHSTQYFQCAKVLQYPPYAELLCREIAGRFKALPVNTVVAPALGGIVVSQETGRQLAGFRSSQGGDQIRTMFAERKNNVMQLRRGFMLGPNDHVLVCEDVVTTGGSVNEIIDIARKAGAEVIGVGCVVDRSGGKVRFGVPEQFAVLHMDSTTYPQSECPLCKQGLAIEKPGSRAEK